MKMEKMSFQKLIVIMFSVLPIIDSINGIFIRNNIPSIGSIYKILIMIILAIPIIREKKIDTGLFNALIGVVVYILSSMTLNYCIFKEPFISLDFPIKLIFNVLMFILLLQNIWNDRIKGKDVYTIFNNNVYLMIGSMLIPYILGMGETIYSGNIGYKGFFYSQNELNASLIVLFYFCLYKVIQKFNLISFCQLVGIFLCVIMMSTKSSLIACAVGMGLFLINCLKRFDARLKLITVVSAVIALFVGYGFIVQKIQAAMTRQVSLFSMYGSDLLATLTSGRVYLIEEAWVQLWESPSYFIQLVIGNGFISTELVEMDLIDIFFYLGSAGAIIAIFILLWIYIYSRNNLSKDKSCIRAIGYLLIIAFSCIAGHVLFMAVSGSYFIMYCCFIMTYSDENEVDYEQCGNDI